MAKTKDAKKTEKKEEVRVSAPTGLYWPCLVNAVRHPQPVALPIMHGPSRFFIRCPCGANAFFPTGWSDLKGLSYEDAINQGFTIFTIAR